MVTQHHMIYSFHIHQHNDKINVELIDEKYTLCMRNDFTWESISHVQLMTN
jgi:hypothetical protein